MNLTARIYRKSISQVLLIAVLFSIFPLFSGTAPSANAASLASAEAAASCYSTVNDSSTAKLDVRVDGSYCVLSFLSGSNTWTPPNGVTRIEYLVVAGGGGGGGNRGGGGGAGGFVTDSDTVNSQVSISVGAGGAGGVNSAKGTNGSDSTLTYTGKNIQAIGGGGGGAPFVGSNVASAGSGGSGGGSGTFASSGTSNTDIGSPGGSGTASQGYAGGSTAGKSGNDGTDSSYSWKNNCTQTWDLIRNSAGGGGAGGKGISGRGGSISNPATTLTCVSSVTPDGGPGRSSSITGTPRTYAGGGGGAAGRFNKNDTENNNYYTAGPGLGGSGIGGTGSPIVGTVGGAGAPNTGSGGGGGGNSWTSASDKGACGSDGDEGCDGGAGGSGIVIIRFQKYLDNSLECASGVAYQSSTIFSYSMFAGDCILTFVSSSQSSTGSNSWTVPTGIYSVRFLLVGGGGGGGNDLGGGGGGGQVLDTASVSVTPNSVFSISIGKGGGNGGGINSGTSGGTRGINGDSTTVTTGAFSIKAYGGGGAWGRDQIAPTWQNTTWSQGGYGSGHTSGYAQPSAIGGATTNGGYAAFGSYAYNAGGGGGAGGAGRSGGNSGAGDGGVGINTDITGFSQCFGGGGGGGASTNISTSPNTEHTVGQGQCGGGNGLNGNISTGQNATANTGGGGGGDQDCTTCTNGGQGAAGIVIIRYTLKTSNQATQNLNMACHGFTSATTPAQSQSASYFGTAFTTDTTTTEFTFPSSGDSTAFHDWGLSNPAGCSTSTDYYTVYMSGYIKAPCTSGTCNIWFAINCDDGGKLTVDGTNLITDATVRGFGNGIDTATSSISMNANSWHYVQMWLHENTGAAAIALYWQTNATSPSGTYDLVPRTYLSRTVPRTINVTVPSLDSSILTATVDTNTVDVRGGPNSPSGYMNTAGTFAFYESGTVISGCSAVTAVLGKGQCNSGSPPSAGVRKYYKVVFTPATSILSTDTQHNVYSPTVWIEAVTLGKVRNANLKIGQYDAFPGISTYPLNVYADGTIYGALTRTLTDTGTAGCALDASRFFLTAVRVGTCTVAVNAAGDSSHYSETTTATIYWIDFKNNFVTQVAAVPTQIALSGQVQIIKHSYDTLTVTSFKNSDGSSVITSASINQVIRIYGTGFSATDMTTVVHLGGGNDLYLDSSIGGITEVDTSDASANWFKLTIPSGTTTDFILVESTKGTVSSGSKLEITTS